MIRVGAVEINTAERRVFVHGVEAQLTRTEFDLLRRMAERPGQVFERERLLSDIWASPRRPRRGPSTAMSAPCVASSAPRSSVRCTVSGTRSPARERGCGR